MNDPTVNEKLNGLAARVAESNGFELVHAEKLGAGKALTIRVFIDKPGGISHDDCSVFSREFGELLDLEDVIPTSYMLEVSSPGLERELYSLRDFEKYSGNLAKLKTGKPIDGQKNFRGRIIGIEGTDIRFDDKTRGNLTIPYDTVVKANLEIDLDEELKRAE